MIRLTAQLLGLAVLIAVVSAEEHGQPYDEWSESPTVTVEGCGVFPSVRVVVDGTEMESRGFVRGGRIFLAAREALEGLGTTVIWVGAERSFYALCPARSTTIRVTLGSPVVRVHRYSAGSRHGVGQLLRSARLDAAPFICGGRVYVPTRAAVEGTGATFQYDRSTNTVRLDPPARRSEQNP
jgi:hypothetical protein